MKKLDATLSFDTPIKFTIRDFIMYLLDTHESFQKDGKGVRTAVRVESAVKAKDEDKEITELTLDDADIAMIHAAAENPGPAGYPMAIGVSTETGEPIKINLSRQCLVFIDAIKKANEQ